MKEIANLESVYELRQSNDKIKELNLMEQADTLKRNILVITVVSLGVILLFVFVIYRRTRGFNAELSKQRAELAASNTVKDRLFSIIGHDLCGPVGNISMILKLLEDENTTTEERSYIINSLKGQFTQVTAM